MGKYLAILLPLRLIDKAAQFGAEADLIRTSVGLEDAVDLSARFQRALDAVVVRKC